MFWIGMIVGIVLTTVGVCVGTRYVCSRVVGSWDKWGEICDAIETASDNRKSYIQVFTDDEVLDTVVLEEIE